MKFTKPLFIIIALFYLLMISYFVSSFCVDTDNAKNFSVNGSCSSDFGYPGSDYCKDDKMVHEYYCLDQNTCWFYDYPCYYGCKDGKCLEMNETSNSDEENTKCFDSDNGRDVNVPGICTDEYGSHFDTCYSDISLYEWYCKDNRCAVNMNRDFCPGPIPEYKCDWKIPAKCSGMAPEKPLNLSCSDSDFGIDVNKEGYTEGLYTDKLIKGKVFGTDSNKCSFREDINDNVSKIYDCCVDSKSSNKLIEAYCDKNNVVQTLSYNCLNGCLNGSCVQNGGNFNVDTCPDGSELKEDILNSVVSDFNSFKCCKPNQCLIDKICVDDGHVDENQWMACEMGQWVKINNNCYDTDHGIDQEKKGVTFSLDGNSSSDCCKAVDDEKDSCVNEGPYLFEAVCKNNEPYYEIIECEKGCLNGVCKIASDDGDSNIPIVNKDVPCYDSDLNSEFPDGRNWYTKGTITYLNEHTNYNILSYNDTCVFDRPDFNLVEGICVKGVDGMYEDQARFNCPHGCKDGACVDIAEHLSDYANVEVSDGQLNELGCCMNPQTNPCDFVPASNCCPNSDIAYVSPGEFTYTSKAGPRNQAECVYEFFYSWPDNSACMRMPKEELKLCTAGCCCEKEYSSNGEHITPQIIDKIDCRGKDKFWINLDKDALFNNCNAQTCSEKLASGDFEKVDEETIRPKVENSDEGIYDKMLLKKGEKEECSPGECRDKLYCLKDYDKPDKMICCPNSTCAVQGECLDSGFEIKRQGKTFLCENSKWAAEEVPTNDVKPKKTSHGCSFIPNYKSPPDFGFLSLFVLLFVMFFFNRVKEILIESNRDSVR